MPSTKHKTCPGYIPGHTRVRVKQTDCKDIAEIIAALTYENEIPRVAKERRRIIAATKKLLKHPQYKTKPYKPPHFKDTCVPMEPSMHTRLRYIRHCSAEPPYDDNQIRQKFDNYYFASTSEEEEIPPGGILRGSKRKMKEKYSKRVRYYDLMPGDIFMPTPIPVVKHTASDQSILSVPSPKTSGEVIQAQKATVKPAELVPPLPPKSGHELYTPHSGIILYRDADFVPTVVHMPGKLAPKGNKHRRNLCELNLCDKNKCRKYAELRKKRYLRRLRKHNAHEPYSSVKTGDGKRRRSLKLKKHRLKDDEICGLDDIPPQEQVHIPLSLKKGTLQTHSLTILPCTKDRKPEIHYGILIGSYNMYDSKFGARSRGRQALPMIVMAYCLAFHYHPKQWTMKLIDNLLNAGDQWYLQCLDKVHDHTPYQGICEVLPFGKKQILLLNAKRMQVLLGEPEIVGYTMSLDPTVYNLCRGLKAFFQENRACVMLSRVLKVIIWKDNICYYIFDPAGRDARAYSNFANGHAALINVKDLDSVSEILLARSILEDQKFVLAPVKVLKVIDATVDDDLESEEENSMICYRIINENCAIVNANMHLGDRCFEDAKYRQALPIAIVAMTYAKISPPNTWFARTVDKVLRLGNKLYLDCMQPKVMTDLTIDNIPNEINVGPFTSEIIIYRERVKGQLFTMKECLVNIKSGLQDFFSHEYNCGILEFNNYHLAVWRQKDMFYMFDPYPRTPDGLRALKGGKACVMMFLNPESMADVFSKNWDYLPPTTLFNIHAFKVLKLKKMENKLQLHCTLSDEHVHLKPKRKVLPLSKAHGDGRDSDGKAMIEDVLRGETVHLQKTEGTTAEGGFDEEQMGDIISLVDSVADEFVPRIPLRYKKMSEAAEPFEPKVVNLDSPTVSVTQVVPAWPQPRDKTNEPPEPDPEPEPTPPPTPPLLPPPEGGAAEEEEEAVEEEEDEETAAQKKEEAKRKKAEEEEARRKAEELPPPFPPPPSPQPEPEVPLAPVQPDAAELQILETLEPVAVDRHVLLTEDAKYRSKLRQIRQKNTPPLAEEKYDDTEETIENELSKPSNFKDLPDTSQIVRGISALTEEGDSKTNDLLPFGAIMAIVTSYKYAINTWTPGIVSFVVDTAQKLYENKQSKFQLAPVHIIPKIALGHQAYQATIDVIREGPTWQLKDILENKFFTRYDRGMVTTYSYSCAIFKRNGLYYLFDGSPCSAMGLRELKDYSKGKACFLRFSTLQGLVSRILYNKDGLHENQQFILSRILVRRLQKEARSKLPEDYDYDMRAPKSKQSKTTIVSPPKDKKSISMELTDQPVSGYQFIDGVYRIEGTTAIFDPRKPSKDVKACHFVSLIAMLMAAMHPIRTWDHVMVDTCIEKGLEIYNKATNLSVCEKRVIKNVILDGKFININIKKIIVVNENDEKTLEQYLRAVMQRLRYVIVRYPHCSLVICQADGYYHLFDPYPPLAEDSKTKEEEKQIEKDKPSKKGNYVATWTLYRNLDALIRRIRHVLPGNTADSPEFYTFELTSVKPAPRHSALNYRLSPLFKPDENPNLPYLKHRKIRPIVDEKMYWLNIDTVPWSRMNAVNDLGFERNTPITLWKDWDIEFPGDLFSLWGTIHPLHPKFDEDHRGKQYLAVSVIAIAMTEAASLSAWTSGFIDGIVNAGNQFHIKCVSKIGTAKNHEIQITDLESKYDDMYPFSFGFKFEKVIFGFVYNLLPDRFNLSKALSYFFEKHRLGILTSPTKNLSFGKVGASYFMFDCQSHGAPLFSPGKGVAYMLKCESLNRLIYCITMTLNIRRHGQQFHLYGVEVTVNEKSK